MVLEHLLATDPRFVVVGYARNGDEAFTMAIALPPVIVLMDVQMPVRDGIEATRIISEFVPAARVRIVSASPRLDSEALAAGADVMARSLSGDLWLSAWTIALV